MISMDRAFSWALVGVAGSGVLGTYEPKDCTTQYLHRMSYGCGCSAVRAVRCQTSDGEMYSAASLA